MKTYSIETLGCKVNQYESDGIGLELEKKGWKKKAGNETADLYVINTCAVTSKAGMQSRQAIRKIIRENPDARVIVTGCHAQTAPEEIRKIEHIDQIVCHRDKTRIADLITSETRTLSALPFKKVDHSPENTFHGFDLTVQGEMTRAYLKIQDGCNAFCTYCIVPHARGSSVSMPEKDIFRHLNALNQEGYREVILTGIHTGLYGLDLKEKTTLTRLLEKLNVQRPVHRVRLSSIEPGELSPEIMSLAGAGGILCDHFHIPLQSGDDEILKKMKRPYDTALFEDLILKIHDRVPHAGIGVDTLIGFPSETDRQFENTFNLIERLPVSYLHVFPFSARKGTPAFHYDKKVPPDVIKERCARMRELDRVKRQAFIRSNLGRRLQGLVQHKTDTKTRKLKAVTSNYLTVFLDKKPGIKGKILDLIPEQCDSDLNIMGKLAD